MTHEKKCHNCGRVDTRGFTKIGNSFVLRGSTRTAQRLNMNNGPAIWECKKPYGCAA